MTWSEILNEHTWGDVLDYSQFKYEDHRVEQREQAGLPDRDTSDGSERGS